jgi:predicted nucleic acid-binding Zn ribbon protein
MTSPRHQGPRPLSEILSELFTARGYGKVLATSELEEAWKLAVGEPASQFTQVGAVRRGVLNVTVAHSALLEELAAFHKPALLAALQQHAPGSVIRDIRFRIGPVQMPAGGSTEIPGKASRSDRSRLEEV